MLLIGFLYEYSPGGSNSITINKTEWKFKTDEDFYIYFAEQLKSKCSKDYQLNFTAL